jgi:hypothetical protein
VPFWLSVGGPSRFIVACGAVGEHSTTAVSASSASSSSSESDVSPRKEICNLVHEASEARGRYSDTTWEVGRLEANLAIVQATRRSSEEETASALAGAADAHAG